MALFSTPSQLIFVFLFTLVILNLSNGRISISPFEPEQVHISTGTSDQMTITWSTKNDTGASYVYYQKDNVTLQASGIRTKFVDGGPLSRVQYIHKVILTGLEPKTTYKYKVGSKLGISDFFSFKTWPSGNNWSPSLLVFGDLGYKNPKAFPRMEAEAATGMYDSVLHVGDFAYDLEDDNGEVGDGFLRLVEPLAASVPYMTCPGNHEQAYNFSNYRYRFEMPGDIDKRMYYSYTMGPVRFISVATELIFYPEYGLESILKHYEWLINELQEANKPENRAKQPWVVTYGHRPMYCSNEDNDDCTHRQSLIRVGIPFLHLLGWEKFFYEYNVDLAIWAHEHSYERLWPVYNEQVKNGSYEHPYTNPRAPVHIVTGSAGCKYDHNYFDNVTDVWSAFRSTDYGYSRMKVYNATHLYFEQVSDDKGGAVVDKFMIIKDIKHTPYPHDPRPIKPSVDPMKKLWNKWKPALMGKSSADVQELWKKWEPALMKIEYYFTDKFLH